MRNPGGKPLLEVRGLKVTVAGVDEELNLEMVAPAQVLRIELRLQLECNDGDLAG